MNSKIENWLNQSLQFHCVNTSTFITVTDILLIIIFRTTAQPFPTLVKKTLTMMDREMPVIRMTTMMKLWMKGCVPHSLLLKSLD